MRGGVSLLAVAALGLIALAAVRQERSPAAALPGRMELLALRSQLAAKKDASPYALGGRDGQGRFRHKYSQLYKQVKQLQDSVEGDQDDVHQRLLDDMVRWIAFLYCK